ncbi:GNAT family N-acetyltransferase [Sporosarcina sp. Te-1]|uniref:GNAT family N-acetyltransferase n=1 Tax=Sporosarcina sp. Te-1 TaxID=2818390 RepID=UPI001A9FDE39|nr:GNAT family N-acetyltransferase [Sporosarcina sp. Te-1]QTD41964.1 GNAT family N-acetyltransferase [Sporosarcina sp. Te-1]
MRIRKAVMSDANGIAKVHVDSWKTTYKDILPDRFLNNLSYEQRTKLWTQNILRKENYIVVAENADGEIVGFADCWKRETNSVPYSSDITSIYLLDQYQGKGIGKRLLKQLFIHLKLSGLKKAFVDVLEENNTRNFYEHYGAKLFKTKQIKIGGIVLNELTYEWHDVDWVLSILEN